MANPNIVNVTTINGMTDFLAPSNTSPSVLLSNAAASGQIWKINSIIASNVSGINDTVTVTLNSAAGGGGTAYSIVKNVVVPGAASLIVTDKSTCFYLRENQSIVVTSGSASAIEYVVSYEVIS